MFYFSLMIGTIITISSSTWIGMWMGLEINLLSIIPLMNNKNMLSTEASMKYFITQALASTMIIFSIIMMSMNSDPQWMIDSNVKLIMNSALITKMGAAPFHFWFPEVMEGSSWNICFMLLTWQKIAPMIMIMYNISKLKFFMVIIIFSMLIGGIQGLNQISMRKIMAYSSINHIGWMISTMFFMETIWILYFIVYSIISINIIAMLSMMNIFYTKQLILLSNNNLWFKLLFIFNFLSLGGLPPFLGFMPKWITIQYLTMENHLMLSLIMVVMTLMTLYYYIRLTFSTLIFNSNELNFQILKIENNFMIYLINSITILGLIFSTMTFNFL
uniref:NADH-ubiquinone oxidoreductase chain 2 n=1 Tax=Tetartopeus terminatum TaxID=879056 RepID=A0A0S2M946_TETTM|nr:NADH dehydrogenase subunit 2 [Tetartopeus terminatus]ALO71194.1 NADH deshydrogenase subunit 2 [Tetartopeus terminatus]